MVSRFRAANRPRAVVRRTNIWLAAVRGRPKDKKLDTQIKLMKIGSLGVLIGLICTLEANAQDYQAVKGSSYAGALTVSDNPASILSTPYPWDITIFSAQLKNSTNAVSFDNLSYLHHGDTLA